MMARLEYRIERIPLNRDEPRLFQLLERLAELGRQGWHVAAADLTPHPSEGRVTVLLERELGDPVPAGGDHPPPRAAARADGSALDAPHCPVAVDDN